MLQKHSKNKIFSHVDKKLNDLSRKFWIFNRFSIVVSIAVMFIYFSAAENINISTKELIDFFTGKILDGMNIFSVLFTLVIYLTIFVTFLLTFFYLTFSFYLWIKKREILITRYEIFALLWFVLLVPTMIVATFVVFVHLDFYNLDSNDGPTTVLNYMIPFIDILLFLPMLILHVILITENLIIAYGKKHIFNNYLESYIRKHVIIQISFMVSISFILSLWGLPEQLIEMIIAFQRTNLDVSKILQYILTLSIFLFIFLTLILSIVFYGNKIMHVHKKKILPASKNELLILLFYLFVLSAFILSSVVMNLWIHPNSNDSEKDSLYLVFGLFNSIVVFPIFISDVVIHTGIVWKGLHHEK